MCSEIPGFNSLFPSQTQCFDISTVKRLNGALHTLHSSLVMRLLQSVSSGSKNMKLNCFFLLSSYSHCVKILYLLHKMVPKMFHVKYSDCSIKQRFLYFMILIEETSCNISNSYFHVKIYLIISINKMSSTTIQLVEYL